MLQYPFKSLLDMPKSDFSLSYMNGTVMEDFLQTDKYKKIWEKVSTNLRYMYCKFKPAKQMFQNAKRELSFSTMPNFDSEATKKISVAWMVETQHLLRENQFR